MAAEVMARAREAVLYFPAWMTRVNSFCRRAVEELFRRNTAGHYVSLALLATAVLACRASAQDQPAAATGTLDFPSFWSTVSDALKSRGEDPNRDALDWVFVISNSGATSNPAVAQGIRDLVRQFAAQELSADSGAADTLSLVPHQLHVMLPYVKSRLKAGTPETDPTQVARYLPHQAEDEGHRGGHDVEDALLYTFQNVIPTSDRSYIIVTLGDTDGSNTPEGEDDYKLTERDPAKMAQLKQAMAAHGMSSSRPTRDFKATYTVNGRPWPIYARLYLPDSAQPQPFATARGHKPAAVPTSTQPLAGQPRTAPPAGSSANLLPIILAILILCALAGAAWMYSRPVCVTIENEPATIRLNDQIVLYGPHAKKDQKGIELKSERFGPLPAGDLATVRNVGRGRVRIASGLCAVQDPLRAGDEVVLQRGQEENVTLKYENGSYPVKVGVT